MKQKTVKIKRINTTLSTELRKYIELIKDIEKKESLVLRIEVEKMEKQIDEELDN